MDKKSSCHRKGKSYHFKTYLNVAEWQFYTLSSKSASKIINIQFCDIQSSTNQLLMLSYHKENVLHISLSQLLWSKCYVTIDNLISY